jgi:hypothetical protein
MSGHLQIRQGTDAHIFLIRAHDGRWQDWGPDDCQGQCDGRWDDRKVGVSFLLLRINLGRNVICHKPSEPNDKGAKQATQPHCSRYHNLVGTDKTTNNQHIRMAEMKANMGPSLNLDETLIDS